MFFEGWLLLFSLVGNLFGCSWGFLPLPSQCLRDLTFLYDFFFSSPVMSLSKESRDEFTKIKIRDTKS